MANHWFRMYAEFAHDPKVQMLEEVMQRRYIMLMCMRCSNDLVTLHDDEVAFHLRISAEQWGETKHLFVRKGFIDEQLNLLNWEKRQFKVDSSSGSAERVAKHRAKKKAESGNAVTPHVTLHETPANALDTDTDTDTEKNKEPNGSVGGTDQLGEQKQQGENSPPLGDNAEGEEGAEADAGMPRCNVEAVVELYHQHLAELPRVRLLSDKRRKAVRRVWRWVLTSKKSDGAHRATNSDEAMSWLRGYFKRAGQNDFLMGRGHRSAEHAGWQCDLDFLLTDRGMQHVIEKTKGGAA